MGRQQVGVRLARLFYGIAAAIALIVASGAVAPAVTGAPGGCQVVLSLGPPAGLGPAGVGPTPQLSPGPSVLGVPSVCTQYVDVALPLVALVLGVILLVTAIRLGREPWSWGASVAVGAIAGIVAALVAAYAVVGISTSDQPQSFPGLGGLLIAGLPVLAAVGSALALWRAHERGRDGTPR